MGVDSGMKNKSPCLILRLLSYKSGSPKLQLFINAMALKLATLGSRYFLQNICMTLVLQETIIYTR